MIIAEHPYWPRILRQIGGLLALFFALSLVALFVDRQGRILRYITIPEMVVSVLGAALSILLAFRTNSAYGRWWEARTLWGAMINNSRSIAREVISFANGSHKDSLEGTGGAFSRRFVYCQIAFVHSVRCSLRRQPPWEEISPFLSEKDIAELRREQNVPAAILQLMGAHLASSDGRRLLDNWQRHRIDQTLSELSNILGGCERIKNTPLPKQYDYYPELLIKIYCLILPFIIADEVGLMTPIITVLVGFAFLVLNRIGKNLEDPFENKPYDVPMSALSRTIEINLRQALGEREVPPALVPVNGTLM